MCGIFAIISSKKVSNTYDKSKNKSNALLYAHKLRHRGPDGTGIYQNDYVCIAHKRLAIIDTEGGIQPFIHTTNSSNTTNTLVLSVNGEIFNYKELRNQYPDYPYKTGSDCESILALYDKIQNIQNIQNILSHNEIVSILNKLDGQFSFILYDDKNKMMLIARDPFGITQLYYGITHNGNIQVSSEMRALEECSYVSVFPCGHYLYINVEYPVIKLIEYFSDTIDGNWLVKPYLNDNNDNIYYDYTPNLIITNDEQIILMKKIKISFEESVIKRLMSDVPFGILLSGGLDSSLVASVSVKYIRAHPEIYGINPIINTFSVGMIDSSDLRAARIVSEFHGTNHHEVIFTTDDIFNTLDEIINILETYDITTIRASLPMYLLTRKIQAMGIKMVLSGEGSDELNGSYLYFHQAPSDKEHQLECKKRILDLGYFDCLRADKSSMGSSVEIRVPFLDTKFVNLCINIHKDIKTQNGIEKYLLRKAFDINNETGMPEYLPNTILWRQKVQFSDGVGTNHIDSLKAFTEQEVLNNSKFAYIHKHLLYPYNTPQTTEAFYYRQKFDSMFPNRDTTIKCWIPNTKWEGVSSDPSGRCQQAFKENEQYDIY